MTGAENIRMVLNLDQARTMHDARTVDGVLRLPTGERVVTVHQSPRVLDGMRVREVTIDMRCLVHEPERTRMLVDMLRRSQLKMQPKP